MALGWDKVYTDYYVPISIKEKKWWVNVVYLMDKTRQKSTRQGIKGIQTQFIHNTHFTDHTDGFLLQMELMFFFFFLPVGPCIFCLRGFGIVNVEGSRGQQWSGCLSWSLPLSRGLTEGSVVNRWLWGLVWWWWNENGFNEWPVDNWYSVFFTLKLQSFLSRSLWGILVDGVAVLGKGQGGVWWHLLHIQLQTFDTECLDQFGLLGVFD